MAELYSHVLPRHANGASSGGSEFSPQYSNSGFLIAAILTAIQSNPDAGGGGALVYTVNTGGHVGYDNRNGGNTDYLTVVIGPNVNGERSLVTAYPGCR